MDKMQIVNIYQRIDYNTKQATKLRNVIKKGMLNGSDLNKGPLLNALNGLSYNFENIASYVNRIEEPEEMEAQPK